MVISGTMLLFSVGKSDCCRLTSLEVIYNKQREACRALYIEGMVVNTINRKLKE